MVKIILYPGCQAKRTHLPKHRFLWATSPMFFESMFSSARRPRNFQVDVDPVDNFESSSTGVRARLSVISGCAAGARLRKPVTEP